MKPNFIEFINKIIVQVATGSSDIIFNGTTATTYEIESVEGNTIGVSLIFNPNGTPFNSTFYIN